MNSHYLDFPFDVVRMGRAKLKNNEHAWAFGVAATSFLLASGVIRNYRPTRIKGKEVKNILAHIWVQGHMLAKWISSATI